MKGVAAHLVALALVASTSVSGCGDDSKTIVTGEVDRPVEVGSFRVTLSACNAAGGVGLVVAAFEAENLTDDVQTVTDEMVAVLTKNTVVHADPHRPVDVLPGGKAKLGFTFAVRENQTSYALLFSPPGNVAMRAECVPKE